MSKQRRIVLSVVFILLGIMALNPMGRMIIKFILPLGFGILDIIGTVSFVLFLLIAINPRGIYTKVKNRFIRNKEEDKIGFLSNEHEQKIKDFIFRLSAVDETGEFTQLIHKIVKLGNKHNRQNLVVGFCDYYGETTIKFLIMKKEEYTKKNDSEILRMLKEGLEELYSAYQGFMVKLLNNDVLDIKTDLKVLNALKIYDNLKGEFK